MAIITAITSGTERERLALRRAEVMRLNGVVKAVLRASAGRRWPDGGWGLALTVYDRIFGARDARGAHWTVYWTHAHPDVHIVESYAITLLFSSADTAQRFEVAGAHTVTTHSASASALADAMMTAPPLRQVLRVPGLPESVSA